VRTPRKLQHSCVLACVVLGGESGKAAELGLSTFSAKRMILVRIRMKTKGPSKNSQFLCPSFARQELFNVYISCAVAPLVLACYGSSL
jgi:hypothetical protein